MSTRRRDLQSLKSLTRHVPTCLRGVRVRAVTLLVAAFVGVPACQTPLRVRSVTFASSYVPSTASASPVESSAPSTLGETPSRLGVVQTMVGLNGRIRACARGAVGEIRVQVVIGSSGAVISAEIADGTLNGAAVANTPTGQCVIDIARTARFEPFQRPQFTVRFPFRFGTSPERTPPPPADVTIEGDLTTNDTRIVDGRLADHYLIALTQGREVTIAVRGGDSTSSPGTVLFMEASLVWRSTTVASTGGATTSFYHEARNAGDYLLRVTTAGTAMGTGHYTVLIWDRNEPNAW